MMKILKAEPKIAQLTFYI